MHFPTWVDLKGEDSVPETVHHVVVIVNPKTDKLWERLGKNHIRVSSLQVELRLLVQYLLCYRISASYWKFSVYETACSI